ncbi:potassium channel subfamily K member 9-like isoform X2 [Pollicipes pollicipes]|uniref:potassium channel subfamily K member 9-like isoform X2 n=1 Tax=Pollicipes pollicipes TaxID=41117 RepID=UPI001884B10A|nr:potassium channel subfamily K member 9-like isoform X2 [Pollicipes pollicipes]
MRSHQNVRTLSLVVFTFTFLLIGAAVFDALESEMDEKHQHVLGDMEENMKRRYGITDEDYRVLETTIIKMEPHKAGPQWKFIGAFYFATVVLVMIGYGHSTPATVGGKAFVILYAIIGIPMGLVMFQHIGERLNKGASIIIKKLKILFRRKNPEISEIDLMVATFFLSTIITTSGAAMFSHYERWSYFESFYYCFITLTTIGFGDYVALQEHRGREAGGRGHAAGLLLPVAGWRVAHHQRQHDRPDVAPDTGDHELRLPHVRMLLHVLPETLSGREGQVRHHAPPVPYLPPAGRGAGGAGPHH